MTSQVIIALIQKAANLKTHASAVQILRLLTENEECLQEVVNEDWFKTSLLQLEDMIGSDLASEEPNVFQREFVITVARLLYELKQSYPNTVRSKP